MDWTGVSFLDDHSPFGLPENSTVVDDSVGIYGNLPHYFPLRQMLPKGAWAPRAAPLLPSSIALRVQRRASTARKHQILDFSVKGGPKLTLVLGPRSAVQSWSLGHLPGGFEVDGAKRRWQQNMSAIGGMDWEVPPARSDCDCLWIFFTEGGRNPAQGRKESFNFSISVLPGILQVHIGAPHLKATTPELQEQLSRAPSWVDLNAWTTEL